MHIPVGLPPRRHRSALDRLLAETEGRIAPPAPGTSTRRRGALDALLSEAEPLAPLPVPPSPVASPAPPDALRAPLTPAGPVPFDADLFAPRPTTALDALLDPQAGPLVAPPPPVRGPLDPLAGVVPEAPAAPTTLTEAADQSRIQPTLPSSLPEAARKALAQAFFGTVGSVAGFGQDLADLVPTAGVDRTAVQGLVAAGLDPVLAQKLIDRGLKATGVPEGQSDLTPLEELEAGFRGQATAPNLRAATGRVLFGSTPDNPITADERGIATTQAVFNGLASLIPVVGANVVFGPAGGAVAAAGLAGGDVFDELEEAGVTGAKKLLFGLPTAAVVAALDRITPGKIATRAKEIIARKVATELVEGVADQAGKEVVTAAVKRRGIRSVMSEILKTGVAEGGQEITQEALQVGGVSAATGRLPDAGEVGERLIQAGIGGFGAGTTVSATTEGLNALPSRTRPAPAPRDGAPAPTSTPALDKLLDGIDATDADAPVPAEEPSRAPQVVPETFTPVIQVRTPEGTKPAVGVFSAPVDELSLDPTRFQFKQEGVDAEGFTSDLKGVSTFNPRFAGIISVWRDPADGKIYVANGQQRTGLARRSGVDRVNVQFLDVETAQEARAAAALINLSEGRGTDLDAATFLKDTPKATPETLAEEGIAIRAEMMRRALALRNLSDDLLGEVRAGRIPKGVGIGIGTVLTDQDQQKEALRIARRKGGDLAQTVVEDIARQVRDAETVDVTQTTLFGEETDRRSLILERAEVMSGLRRQINEDRRTFQAVNRGNRADILEGAGQTQVDRDAVAQAASDSSIVGELFDRLSNTAGPVGQAITDAARRVASGESIRPVLRDAFPTVRDALLGEATRARAGRPSEARPSEPRPDRDARPEVGTERAIEPEAGDGTEPGDVRAPDSVDPDQSGLFGNDPAPAPPSPTAQQATPEPPPAPSAAPDAAVVLAPVATPARRPRTPQVPSDLTSPLGLPTPPAATPAAAPDQVASLLTEIRDELRQRNEPVSAPATPEPPAPRPLSRKRTTRQTTGDPQTVADITQRQLREDFRAVERAIQNGDPEAAATATDKLRTQRDLLLADRDQHQRTSPETPWPPLRERLLNSANNALDRVGHKPGEAGPRPDGLTLLSVTDPVSAAVALAREVARVRRQREAEQRPLVPSAIPEIEERIQKNKGIPTPGIAARAREGLAQLKSATKVFPGLDINGSTRDAILQEILLETRHAGNWAQTVAIDRIMEITKGLTPGQMDTFSRALYLPDIRKDVEKGLYGEANDAGQYIDSTGEGRLPFGYASLEELDGDLAAVEATVNDTPDLKAAVARRQAFVPQVTRTLVHLDLLDARVLADPRYYHRQVMQYVALMQNTVTGRPRDVRQRTRGFQWQRVGGGDFNTSYPEAEFEWIAQAYQSIHRAQTLLRVRELSDIAKDLKKRAKHANLAAVEQIVNPQGDLDPKDHPLVQFRRRVGRAANQIVTTLAAGKVAVDPKYDSLVDMLSRQKQAKKPLNGFDHPMWWTFLREQMESNGELAPQAGSIFKAIAERETFIKETLGTKYIDPRSPDSLLGIAPEGYVTWQPKEGNIWFRGVTLTERALDMALEGIAPPKSELRQALLQGGVKETWIIPEGVAHTLDNLAPPPPSNVIDKILVGLVSRWKVWTLINPSRVVRYNVNNMSGDLDAGLLFPKVLVHLPRATNDLKKWRITKTASPELKAELEEMVKLRVIDSGFAVQEIPEISQLPEFELIAKATPLQFMGLLTGYWKWAKTITVLRENMLRLAAYRHMLDQVNQGKTVFGASNPNRVRALQGKERAALLARDLIGDYGALSQAGQFARSRPFPFFSWKEVNAKRYYWLFRNIAIEGGGTQSVGEAAERVARVVGAAGVRTAVGLGAKAVFTVASANLFFMVVNAFNHFRFPDEEEELGENRRQFHLLLGRNKDGSIRSLRIEGAFADFLSWVNLQDYPSDVKDLLTGSATVGDKLIEAGQAPIEEFASLMEPMSKTALELATGRATYPSPFRPRPIRDKGDHVAGVLSMSWLWRRVTDRPLPPGSGFEGLLFYRTDPGEAAYWLVQDRKFRWLEGQDKGRPPGDPTPRSTALYYAKQATRWGETAKADRWFQRYIAEGGTPQGLRQSLRLSAPGGGLNARDRKTWFATLTPQERQSFELAEQWFANVYQNVQKRRPTTRGIE